MFSCLEEHNLFVVLNCSFGLWILLLSSGKKGKQENQSVGPPGLASLEPGLAQS
jgi:hypothetical protein